MLWMWLLLSVIALAVLFVKVTGAHNEAYWKKRGVVFWKENRVMGPMLNFFLKDCALFEVFSDLYKKYPNAPAVAFGSFWTPSIFVHNPTNVQHVLQNDFSSFNHRGIEPIEGDTLTDNLLFHSGPRWKVVRQNISPIFTSAKLKNMYYIVDKSAQDFLDYLKQNPERLKDHVFDTMSTFCSAAVSAAVFGIGTDSVFNSPLLTMARKTTTSRFSFNFKFVLALMSPNASKKLGLAIFKEHEIFFVETIRKVLEERKSSKVKMHDFADLCLNIEEKGTMIERNSNYSVEPSVELFAAQAFFFFIAGVEPCALAAHNTLIELGRHPEYLKMVHEEIDAAFEKHGQMNFDIVNGLEVLDKVYIEALRINTPVGTINRQCTQDTTLPVGNIAIAKGTQITIPIYDLHMDERYYPNPQKFDPERWAPGGDGNKDLYMPFGKGNRLCIGARYATIQVKAGLVHLLRHYTVKTHVQPGPPKFKKHPVQVMDTKLRVEVMPRNL